jgi:RNA-directed DNA polymerase
VPCSSPFQPGRPGPPQRALAAGAKTTDHEQTVSPATSAAPGPPRPLQPPVTQRHLEAEIANCVGGVISPVLANLFMHYAFDLWLGREFPAVEFERYADDGVIHCVSEYQARKVLAALHERMAEVGLALHPDKTRIVYCKDSNRRGSHEHTSFTFLGFTFRPRRARRKDGGRFTSFQPAISKDALKKISAEIRSWRLHRWVNSDGREIAKLINPKVRGWMGY